MIDSMMIGKYGASRVFGMFFVLFVLYPCTKMSLGQLSQDSTVDEIGFRLWRKRRVSRLFDVHLRVS